MIESIADGMLQAIDAEEAEAADECEVDELTGTDSMKPAQAIRVAWRDERPTPGWKSHGGGVALQNPRTPAVPATLDLTIEEYYAAAALVGILGAQKTEPDMGWAAAWSLDMGAVMAAESRKRRRKR